MELVDVSGRSRPSDKGGWGGHPDPKIKGGRRSPKKLFSVLRSGLILVEKWGGARAPRCPSLYFCMRWWLQLFCSQLQILERRNCVPPDETSSRGSEISSRLNDISFCRNEVSLRRSESSFWWHEISQRNFVSCREISFRLITLLAKFRRFLVWSESSQFDCRNSRNFADFGKFRLHLFCTVL